MTKKKAMTATSGKRKSTRSRNSNRMGSKTKKVLGKMLAGAAVGAVRGAAEAAQPGKERENRHEKSASSTRSRRKDV